jgi:hypothetical protein
LRIIKIEFSENNTYSTQLDGVSGEELLEASKFLMVQLINHVDPTGENTSLILRDLVNLIMDDLEGDMDAENNAD